MLFAGVGNLGEYLIVALLWGLPFALLAAVPLVAAAKGVAGTPAKFVLHMLSGLGGALAGYSVGYRMYWQAHGPTPAIVYFLGGVVAGGICGIVCASVVWRLAVRARDRSTSAKNQSA